MQLCHSHQEGSVSNTNALINSLPGREGRGGGVVNPGTYAGMGRDLLTLVDDFERVGIGCTFVAKSSGKDSRDL